MRRHERDCRRREPDQDRRLEYERGQPETDVDWAVFAVHAEKEPEEEQGIALMAFSSSNVMKYGEHKGKT